MLVEPDPDPSVPLLLPPVPPEVPVADVLLDDDVEADDRELDAVSE